MNSLQYRPAIDGVRAVAVLSVFIFHLNRHWLQGGFIGVDVFFVISGYLITSLIYRSCSTSQFSLATFYQRRIARIAPAFFLVAFCTIFGCRLFYQPQDLQQGGASLLSASLSMLNISLMKGRPYFEISPDASPFMHYWSLSVEEQYYLIFPLCFWLLFKYCRPHLILILGLGNFVSLILCVCLTSNSPLYAFYLLPSRAWELCAGAMLAVIVLDGKALSSKSAFRWLPLFGMVLLIGSLFLFNDSIPFPGWAATLPVIGTLFIIVPLVPNNSQIEKLLSRSLLVHVGKRSYSMYLWHWPVFSFVDYTLFTFSDSLRLPLKAGISIFIAEVSYSLIENPLRSFFNRSKNLILSYIFLFSALVGTVSVGQYYKSYAYVNATPSDLSRGGLYFPQDHAEGTVMLMGDSNGSMYGNALKDLCVELHYNLVVVSVGAYDTLPFTSEPQNQLWFESLESIKRYRPDCIIIANLWTDKLKDSSERLEMTLRAILPQTERLILITQPPHLPTNAVRQSFRFAAFPPQESAQAREPVARINRLIRGYESKQISIVDAEKIFLDQTNFIKLFDDEGRLNFYDAGHLSVNGSRYVCNNMRSILGALRKAPHGSN